MIDIVDQIQEEMAVERQTRGALSPLPVSVLLEAFPDELRLARRGRNALRRAIQPWLDQVQICKNHPDQVTSTLLVGLCRLYAPVEDLAALGRAESLCAAYRAVSRVKQGDGEAYEGIDAQMVERARAVAVEGLYAFERPKRIGRRFVAVCPFHPERTGSFFVFPDNKFKCFSCGERGDAIDFVCKTMGMEFIEAVKYLQGRG